SAARSYFMRAVAAFAAWGADGKVAQLRDDPLFERRETAAPARLDSSAALDVVGLAEAGQVIAQERNPDVLPGLLFDVVRRYAAAERGRLLWLEEGHWVERAGFDPEGQWVSAPGDPTGETHAPLPPMVGNYLTQSLQPLLLQNVGQHARFGHDTEVQRLGIKSIVGLPIQHRGETVGLLYLDNLQTHTLLEPSHLQTLRLLGLQFAVAYENAHVHRRLEAMLVAKSDEARRGNQLLQAILASSPAQINVRDREGRYIAHNGRFMELFGRAGESMIGQLAYDLPDPARALDWRRRDEEVLKQHRSQLTVDQVLDGDVERSFQVNRFPVHDVHGRVYAVGTITVEVTELKQAQQVAEAATRAKSDFLANMSHEI
ncbi:MAG: PAS domain-containing protein, partial [Solirubrobacteraceae bacterium]|nr:PAS domain-containing protein [Solirubrobacteraceae bacterium]